MDTKKLILLIQERECLWNQESEYYHSRDVQRRIWNEVAEKSKISVEEVKKKWRGLRDIFRREYKKVTTSRSDDSGEEYIPKWPYYKIMFFLKDTTTSRDLKGSVPFEVEKGAADQSESESVHDFTTENGSGIASQIPSPETQQQSTSRRVFKSPLKKTEKRPREVSDFDNKLLKIEEEKLKLFKGSIEDSEMRFLMSLHPFLKQIPRSRQLAVRANMMEALISEQAVQQYSPKPSPSYQSSDDE